MKHLKVGFIGAGNMAASMIGGLLEQGCPRKIFAPAIPAPRRWKSSRTWRRCWPADNSVAVDGADIVVLAVKPQVMAEVTASIREPLAAQGAMARPSQPALRWPAWSGVSGGHPQGALYAQYSCPVRAGASALYGNSAAGSPARNRGGDPGRSGHRLLGR